MEIQTDNPKEGYPFPCFSYDKHNSVTLNTAYIMSSETVDVRYILGILNSSLGSFLFKLYVTQLQQRQFRMLAQYVSNFPIVQASKKRQDSIIELVEKRLKSHSLQIEDNLNEIVLSLYGLKNEECDYIKNRED